MKTRDQLIDELPDEIIAEAKAELSGQEWFEFLKTNGEEDSAVFSLALEMQAERRRAA